MTLSVWPYRRTPQGELEWLTVDPTFNDLAGIESTRWSFWGSPTLKAQGLSLVTGLAQTDVYAEGDDLDLLKQEIQTLVNYTQQLTQKEKSYWQVPLSNILEAIRVAQQHQGGVYIG